jgi:hypothetical protein
MTIDNTNIATVSPTTVPLLLAQPTPGVTPSQAFIVTAGSSLGTTTLHPYVQYDDGLDDHEFGDITITQQ